MPPALSDDEQSDVGDVSMPLRVGRSPSDIEDEFVDATNGDDADVKGEDEEDDDEDEDDEDDEVYVVEAIKKHMVDENGELRFQVKWEGYDKKADMTWEPEENLADSATEILEEYLKSIGGRDAIFQETEKASRGKKRGRQPSKGQAGTKRSRKNDSHPAEDTPPATVAAAKKWTPPTGSWEDDINYIDACEEVGTGKLMVYLNWKNGQKTKHETSVIYKKCPQKMLRFYEKHVRIIARDENKPVGDVLDKE